MKKKRMSGMLVILALAFILTTGCGAQSDAAEPAPDAEILSAVSSWREKFDAAATDPKITGTTYYISNQGDDNNDGLSPETAWATLDRAFETDWPLTRGFLQPGDAVLLERGGTWYISSDEREGCTSDVYNIPDGVTLGAYGEGERLIVRGDIPRANNADFWTLWYNEDGVKIWASTEKILDSNVIVFDGGKVYAKKETARVRTASFLLGATLYK